MKRIEGVSMKYNKKQGLYRAGNLSFNPETGEAYSYSWFKLTEKVGQNSVLLNTYAYSSTTGRQIQKLRILLNQLGINVVSEIDAPRGLDELDLSIQHYINLIQVLSLEISKPGSREEANQRRREQIKEYQDKLVEVNYYKTTIQQSTKKVG